MAKSVRSVRTRGTAFLAAFTLLLALGCGGDRGGDSSTPAFSAADTSASPVSVSAGADTGVPARDASNRTASRFPDAPELVGLTGWINSEPLTVAGLNAERRVVLIDVWTYTCVNCIRTFPYLKIWHERYKDHGLTIIGIHSPEFEFEKVPANVKAAVERYGFMYPIAQDNDMKTWDAFINSYWPSKYLIGVDGGIRFQHFGEGEYLQTENEIRTAVKEAGWDVSGIPVSFAVFAFTFGNYTDGF